MRTGGLAGTLVVLLLFSSCAGRGGRISEAESREVVESVTAGMKSYAAALGSLQPERIISHYAESPDFRLTSDGAIHTREGMHEVLGELDSSLDRMEVTWQSITVTPLAPDAAVALAPFRTLNVAKDNSVSRVRGVATWVWVRRNGEWRMLYGHGDHYPDTEEDKETRNPALEPTARVEERVTALRLGASR